MSELNLLCNEVELAPGGAAFSFLVRLQRRSCNAFALRLVDGSLRAYLNRCPHMGAELDGGSGLFYADGTSQLLRCCAHGVLFDPASGLGMNRADV